MSKHTPGPWARANHESANHYCINPGRQGSWIAVLQLNGEQMDREQEANVNLITAAPELLEALEAAQAAMLSIQRAVYDELVGDAGTTLAKAGAHAAKWHYREVAAQIRAAIAKARGESS